MKRNITLTKIIGMAGLCLLLALPGISGAEDPLLTTLSISRVTSRGAFGGFGVVDASGCVQTAIGVVGNLSLERVLPSPSVRGTGLTVVLSRFDVCLGVLLISADGTILDPVITVDKDLRSASVSAETFEVFDRVSSQRMTVGPIDVTWTAAGHMTALSGTVQFHFGDLFLLSTGNEKFRNAQAQGSVFFEGINLAEGGSRLAEIFDAKDLRIEILRAE